MAEKTPRQQALSKYGQKKILVVSPIYLTDRDEAAAVRDDAAVLAEEYPDVKTAVLRLMRKDADRLRRKKLNRKN